MPKPGPRRSDGQRQLAAYIRERKVSLKALGEQIGVSDATVFAWQWAQKSPTAEKRAEIERVTGIPASAWETTEERKRREMLEGRPAATGTGG